MFAPLFMPTLHLHTAEILLPMGGLPPVTDAAVVVDDDGTIVFAGKQTQNDIPCETVTRHALLMPGVVNCHTHLTDAGLSEMIPGGTGLNEWIVALRAQRDAHPINPETLHDNVLHALQSLRNQGTVAVGEVSNTFDTLPAILASGMRCRFVFELIAFMSARAETVFNNATTLIAEQDPGETVNIVPGAHAPYSVSPALMEILAGANRQHGTFLYQHLAEDPDERELYMTGGGRCRDLLEHFKAWDETWKIPSCSPIELYRTMGLLDDSFVGVHLTDATPDELAVFGRHKAKAILCPRANMHITGRLPNLELIVKNDITFGLGTDGNGCVPTLDVFDDARALFERYYDLKPGIFLNALTTGGAEILQFDELGSIAVGARPGLVSVEIGELTEDVGKLEEQILWNPHPRPLS